MQGSTTGKVVAPKNVYTIKTGNERKNSIVFVLFNGAIYPPVIVIPYARPSKILANIAVTGAYPKN